MYGTKIEHEFYFSYPGVIDEIEKQGCHIYVTYSPPYYKIELTKCIKFYNRLYYFKYYFLEGYLFN